MADTTISALSPMTPSGSLSVPVSDGTTTGRVSISDIGGVPVGTIVMWSNYNGASIPSGWALCDGQAGRPDLRDRFAVGAGSTYPLNTTGGQASVTGTVGATSLNSTQQSSFRSSTYAPGAACGGKNQPACATYLTGIASYGGSHTHPVTVATLPPYISLHYIIKIS